MDKLDLFDFKPFIVQVVHLVFLFVGIRGIAVFRPPGAYCVKWPTPPEPSYQPAPFGARVDVDNLAALSLHGLLSLMPAAEPS